MPDSCLYQLRCRTQSSDDEARLARRAIAVSIAFTAAMLPRKGSCITINTCTVQDIIDALQKTTPDAYVVLHISAVVVEAMKPDSSGQTHWTVNTEDKRKYPIGDLVSVLKVSVNNSQLLAELDGGWTPQQKEYLQRLCDERCRLLIEIPLVDSAFITAISRKGRNATKQKLRREKIDYIDIEAEDSEAEARADDTSSTRSGSTNANIGHSSLHAKVPSAQSAAESAPPNNGGSQLIIRIDDDAVPQITSPAQSTAGNFPHNNKSGPQLTIRVDDDQMSAKTSTTASKSSSVGPKSDSGATAETIKLILNICPRCHTLYNIPQKEHDEKCGSPGQQLGELAQAYIDVGIVEVRKEERKVVPRPAVLRHDDRWCEVCNVTVTGETNWIQHSTGDKHRRQVERLSQVFFYCKTCSNEVHGEENLFLHLKGTKHLRLAERHRWNCTRCTKRFTSDEAYVTHFLTAHKR